MTFNWKHSAGAFALSVALLAPVGGQMVEAKPVETGQLLIKDRPKISAEKGKSATIPPPTDDVAPTEKGIKDPGVKSCNGCGMTGRQAAPPAVDDGAAPSTEKGIKDNAVKGAGNIPPNRVAAPPPIDDGAAPPSTEYGVDRQILEKPPRETMRSAATGPSGGAGVDTPPSAEYGVDGQIIDRGRDRPRVAERRAHNGPGGTPPSTAKKGGKTGWILGITAGAAALAAVLASGNNDKPTSP